ncbi:sterol carrier family protein [Corynebacterium doosanense]|uniref:Bacterial SCP orthologue domain-containing protein n=1 Tax=Corynebacterium doosanense CAU 212 = DSM 45436 TaxID=558173 RepID=A0A097II44_9CORY|nr:sterol carrier family protein [Corynebacterium doosanense]AIT61786.1 hypothetical protein CDOO_11310 [Corynebacterium doosanense CAU 212 = DSM 45436]
MAKKLDPAQARQAVAVVGKWLETGVDKPSRNEIAAAVRATARLMAQDAPGHSVEVRVPPFVAVQCIEGPRHTRGTPPNVVETDAHTWLLMATGRLKFAEALDRGLLDVSGSRAAEVSKWLPVFGPLVAH